MVGVPDEYRPLNLLLQLDLQGDPELLDELIRVAGDPSVETYDIGTDACGVSVNGSQVTVELGDGNGSSATFSRDDFRDALMQFQRVLDDPPPEPPRSRPRWQPPF